MAYDDEGWMVGGIEVKGTPPQDWVNYFHYFCIIVVQLINEMVNDSRAVTIQFRTLKKKGFCTILTHQELNIEKQGLSHLVSTRPLVSKTGIQKNEVKFIVEMCVEEYYSTGILLAK